MDRPQSQPVKIASPDNESPQPAGTAELGGSEALELKEQVKHGDLTGLREYLARTRRECDWQDRVFMLSLVVPNIRLADMDNACEMEPEAADLFLIRCALLSELSATMRGSGTAEKVTGERFRNTTECIKAALNDLDRTAQLDALDPTAQAYVLPSLTLFGHLASRQRRAFQQATELAPDLVPAHRAIVNALSERWHGSHELSLKFARNSMTKAGPGSDMAACLFWAHLLVRSHLSSFDKDSEAAKSYAYDPEVTRELNAAFDDWIQPPYTPRRSSIPYLHYAACWYYLAGDSVRLQRALALTDNVFSKIPWSLIGNSKKIFARALRFAAGPAPQRQSIESSLEERCFAALALGVQGMEDGELDAAETSLSAALQLAQSAPKDLAGRLNALVLANFSLLRHRERRDAASQALRRRATDLLDTLDTQLASAKYQLQMAKVLYKLGDYRRAIPFWEQAIGLAGEEVDSTKMAGMLFTMGECYCRIGLLDHATVPLRSALKIYRAGPENSRLPIVLLTLGNSLRKSSPAEAEACYQEAAELDASRLQYLPATSAWVNLGVLCSEQGRFAESLEHYERVLRVREQSPGTPPTGIATVLNNIANSYRRMGKFPEAHAAVDRAIELFSAEDAGLASGYGTRGLIFLDAGDDMQAVEWLRKSRDERWKRPSPDLEATVENLESEIAALKRLSREEEAASAQETLASVRATIQAIPLADSGLSASKAQLEGAVLVELAFGNRPFHPDDRKNTMVLADKLSNEVQARDAGYYSGWVAIPETTTLVFYGPDAETLFKVLEPFLMNEPICAGAKVAIRQGGIHREVVVPRKKKKRR
jgi:tetratricopeptide (TPR) repeat protein